MEQYYDLLQRIDILQSHSEIEHVYRELGLDADLKDIYANTKRQVDTLTWTLILKAYPKHKLSIPCKILKNRNIYQYNHELSYPHAIYNHPKWSYPDNSYIQEYETYKTICNKSDLMRLQPLRTKYNLVVERDPQFRANVARMKHQLQSQDPFVLDIYNRLCSGWVDFCNNMFDEYCDEGYDGYQLFKRHIRDKFNDCIREYCEQYNITFRHMFDEYCNNLKIAFMYNDHDYLSVFPVHKYVVVNAYRKYELKHMTHLGYINHIGNGMVNRFGNQSPLIHQQMFSSFEHRHTYEPKLYEILAQIPAVAFSPNEKLYYIPTKIGLTFGEEAYAIGKLNVMGRLQEGTIQYHILHCYYSTRMMNRIPTPVAVDVITDTTVEEGEVDFEIDFEATEDEEDEDDVAQWKYLVANGDEIGIQLNKRPREYTINYTNLQPPTKRRKVK